MRRVGRWYTWWGICVLGFVLSCSSQKSDHRSVSPVDGSPTQMAVSQVEVVIDHQKNVPLGETCQLGILLQNRAGFGIRGFTLTIGYDANLLMLLDITNAGSPLYDSVAGCGWEFFRYYIGTPVPCKGECPSGVVTIIGIAELSGGVPVQSCGWSQAKAMNICSMQFLAANADSQACHWTPVRFFWRDCQDNGFGAGSDTLLVARSVRDYQQASGTYTQLGTDTAWLPGIYGPTAECDSLVLPIQASAVAFYNGGVQFACAGLAGQHGDLNLDGVIADSADVDLFAQYFLYGTRVFTIAADSQAVQANMNGDGHWLSIADYIWLVLRWFGHSDWAVDGDFTCRIADSSGVISVDSTLGAVALRVQGEVTPQLLAEHVTMMYRYVGGYTRILITPPVDGSTDTVYGFTGPFLKVNGQLAGFEGSTPDGRLAFARLPSTEYRLGQNYPNPFEFNTSIPFSMPKAGWYTIYFFDLLRKQVGALSGWGEAGDNVAVWRPANVADGMYMYRFQSGGAELWGVMERVR